MDAQLSKDCTCPGFEFSNNLWFGLRRLVKGTKLCGPMGYNVKVTWGMLHSENTYTGIYSSERFILK